jgi:hypothetical protein
MASTKALRPGMVVKIRAGALEGRSATVLNTTVINRKILVRIDDPHAPWEEYILPKLLDDYLTIEVPHNVPSPPPEAVTATRSPITSLDDPFFDKFRPKVNPKSYLSRVLPGGLTDIEALIQYFSNKGNGWADNIALAGDTQSGKTMLVEVLAHHVAKCLGLTKPVPVFTLSGSSSITDYDIYGQYRPVDGQTPVWMEGILALAARWGGIAYIDEVNALPGNVTSALHPLLDDRRQFVNLRKPVLQSDGSYAPEVVNANKNLWVICTYNPGYSGMAKTNEAFVNRFRVLQWDYDRSVEKKLVTSPTVLLLGEALRTARSTRAINTPVGTSALVRLDQDLKTYNPEYALWAFCGSFTNATERSRVEEIIADRSIRDLLIAESNMNLSNNTGEI